MCCLKFENEVYTHLKKGMPSTGEEERPRTVSLSSRYVKILENKIKTRLVLEEGDKKKDIEEKLSTEFYSIRKRRNKTYVKEESSQQ